MKTYRGYTPHSVLVYVLNADGVGGSYPLAPRLDLRNHSPTGFSWGYAGSGPAQLALAILADLYDAPTALRLYQEFKFKVIVGLKGDEAWELTEAQVRAAVEQLDPGLRQGTKAWEGPPAIQPSELDWADSSDTKEGTRLLAHIKVAGCDMHLEAYEVTYKDGTQEQVFEGDFGDTVDAVYSAIAADGVWQTVEINGREYVLIATPFC